MTEQQASDKLNAAKNDAAKKEQEAKALAQAHIAAKQKEADAITQPAQANLDAKRRELQNS